MWKFYFHYPRVTHTSLHVHCTFIFMSCFMWTKPVEEVSSGTQYAVPVFVGVCSLFCSRFKGDGQCIIFSWKGILVTCLCYLVWHATPRVSVRHLWAGVKAHRQREIFSRCWFWSTAIDHQTDLLSCIYIKYKQVTDRLWLGPEIICLRKSI